MNVLLLYGHVRLLSDLPESEIHHGVEDDQRQQRYQTMDEEIHVDDVNFVVVTILTETGANNDQILQHQIKLYYACYYMMRILSEMRQR